MGDAPVDGQQREAVRIVVIEDDFSTALFIERLLSGWGYDVVSARDGEHGLSKVRDVQPHIVLCDICLPGIDGYAVATAILRGREYGVPKLIAMTAYEGAYPRRRSQEFGFQHHLSKPISAPVLKQLLSAVSHSLRPSERPEETG